jgi:hypothetical protein
MDAISILTRGHNTILIMVATHILFRDVVGILIAVTNFLPGVWSCFYILEFSNDVYSCILLRIEVSILIRDHNVHTD